MLGSPPPSVYLRWVLVIGLVVGSPGCGSGDERARTTRSTTTVATATTTVAPVVPPAPVSGLLATVEVSRLFSLDRALALGLQNVGTEPVEVVRIRLETPLFEPVSPTDRVVPLTPGGRELVMPVPYGPARCDGDPPPDDFEAVVDLADGRQVRLGAPERNAGGIGRLRARECAALAVAERATLRLGERWTRDGGSVVGELVLEQQRSGASVVVEEIAGSVIFGVTVEEDPPILRVDDDRRRASVPVVVSADRCDPHALIEAKKAFVFLAWVRVDGADVVPVEVRPEGAARAALDELFSGCLG